MEENILPLLKIKFSKALYSSKRYSVKKIQKEFARFLAAYYLDFPLVFCQNEKQNLPDLFQWSEKTESGKHYINIIGILIN